MGALAITPPWLGITLTDHPGVDEGDSGLLDTEDARGREAYCPGCVNIDLVVVEKQHPLRG